MIEELRKRKARMFETLVSKGRNGAMVTMGLKVVCLFELLEGDA